MRHTKKVSVWPVGFVSRRKYQTPIIKNGKVITYLIYSPSLICRGMVNLKKPNNGSHPSGPRYHSTKMAPVRL